MIALRHLAERQTMLRFIIAIVATFELAYFYVELPFSLSKMIDLNARWFNILSGLCMVVFAPVLTLAAFALAAMGRRLGLAAILLAVAPLVYWAPFFAFFVGIMIYGF